MQPTQYHELRGPDVALASWCYMNISGSCDPCNDHKVWKCFETHSYAQVKYSIFNEERLKERQSEMVEQTATLLAISEAEAARILRIYKWSAPPPSLQLRVALRR